jgi:hypothetical protein
LRALTSNFSTWIQAPAGLGPGLIHALLVAALLAAPPVAARPSPTPKAAGESEQKQIPKFRKPSEIPEAELPLGGQGARPVGTEGAPSTEKAPSASAPASFTTSSGKPTPRFKTPSELTGPPALVLGQPPASDQPAPGAPQAETAARPVVPAVRRVSPVFPNRGLGVQRFGYLRLVGTSDHVWRQSYFTQQPTSGARRPSRHLITLQGGYEYVEPPFRDFSHLALGVDTEVSPGAQVGVLWSRELREETADLLGVRMLAELSHSYALEGRVAAGFGAGFVPVTQLSALGHGVALERKLIYSVGFDGAWMRDRRWLTGGVANVGYWFEGSHYLGFSQRVAGASSHAGIRQLALESKLDGSHGVHGDQVYFWSASAGRLPWYSVDTTWRVEAARWLAEGQLGARRWLGTNYGLVARALLGWQQDTYINVGARVGLFLEAE